MNKFKQFREFFWDIVDIIFLGACFSALVWCVVWTVGFILFLIASSTMNIPTETTALAITITVLLGHLPKFVAMFFGTDTDFQDIRFRFANYTLRDAPWIRLVSALASILFLILVALPGRTSSMVGALNPLDATEFLRATLTNFAVCLNLFIIQLVFSFPSDIIVVDSKNGKNLIPFEVNARATGLK